MATQTETRPVETETPQQEPEIDQHLGAIGMARSGTEVVTTNPHANFEAKAAQAISGHTKLRDNPGELERYFELTSEQAEGAVSNAEAMRPSARVAVRMPRFAFEAMLEDGQYLTAQDTGYSHGSALGPDAYLGKYLDGREKAERLLGITPGEDNPSIVYGYVDYRGNEHEEQAARYGSLALILKPEVIARSTFTINDSMDGGIYPIPHDFEDAVLADQAEASKSYAHGLVQHYVEAQILGGVTMDDVEGIVLTVNPNNPAVGRSGETEEWQQAEEVERLLETMTERYPDIEVTVRIRCYRGFEKKFLDLADKYPKVKFIGVVDIEDTDLMPSYSSTPGQTVGLERRLLEDDLPVEDIEELKEEAEDRWLAVRQRQQELEEKMPGIWQRRGGGQMPTNLSFVATKSRKL